MSQRKRSAIQKTILACCATILFLIGIVNSSSGYLPHAKCCLDNPVLVSMNVLFDLSIAAADGLIAWMLWGLFGNRMDVAYSWMFLAFAAFILAHAATHLMEIITMWIPVYWASLSIKAVCAMASISTVVVFWESYDNLSVRVDALRDL